MAILPKEVYDKIDWGKIAENFDMGNNYIVIPKFEHKIWVEESNTIDKFVWKALPYFKCGETVDLNKLKGDKIMSDTERLKGLNLIAIKDSPENFYKKDATFKLLSDSSYYWDIGDIVFDPLKENVKLLLDEIFLQRFRNEKIVVNCETKKEAKEFAKFCKHFNLKWTCGKSFKRDIAWDIYKNKTCYNLNYFHTNVIYSDRDWYKEKDYTIIKFSDTVLPNNIQEDKEKEMKYKVIKPFTLKDIIEKKPCMDEFNKLAEELNDSGQGVEFKFDTKHLDVYTTLHNNLDWLEDNDFIEGENTFEPFDLTFNIKSADELRALYCNLNVSEYHIRMDNKYSKYFTEAIFNYTQDFWRKVNKEMYRIEE